MPKCGPCERTGSTCEYYDPQKGQVIKRNYIVYLQHKILALEDELERAASHNLSASREKKNQELDEVALAPSGAAGEPSFMAAIEQPASNHEPTLKTCVMCRRSVAHSNKSELRYPVLAPQVLRSPTTDSISGSIISKISNHTYDCTKIVPPGIFDTRHLMRGQRIFADSTDKPGDACLDATTSSSQERTSNSTWSTSTTRNSRAKNFRR